MLARQKPARSRKTQDDSGFKFRSDQISPASSPKAPRGFRAPSFRLGPNRSRLARNTPSTKAFEPIAAPSRCSEFAFGGSALKPPLERSGGGRKGIGQSRYRASRTFRSLGRSACCFQYHFFPASGDQACRHCLRCRRCRWGSAQD